MRKGTILVFIFVPIMTVLIAGLSLNILVIYGQMNSNGKMTMMMDGGTNMTSTMANKSIVNDDQKIENGTINIKSTLFDAIDSKINVTLSQAANIAQEFFGNNNSRVVMAQLDEYNGYLVYLVCVMDSDMNLTHAFIDPGKGTLLGTQRASMTEVMMMHGKMFMGGAMKMNSISKNYDMG